MISKVFYTLLLSLFMDWYKKLLSALYLSTFLIRASFGIMLTTFPLYLLLPTGFTLGLLDSIPPLLELITVLGIGAIVDRYGRRNVLLYGLVLGAIALFALVLTKNLYAIGVINAFHGISAGMILVSSLALIADYAPKNARGREMGAFDFVNIFGWITGFALGGLFIQYFSGHLEYSFMIAGILALIGGAYSYFNISEPKKEEYLLTELKFGVIISVLKKRSVLLLSLPWLIIYILIGTFVAFIPAETHGGGLGLSGLEVGVILAGGGGLFLATQIFYGKLSDKYGRMPIMAIGVIGIVGIMGILGFAYLTTQPIEKPDFEINANEVSNNSANLTWELRENFSYEVHYSFNKNFNLTKETLLYEINATNIENYTLNKTIFYNASLMPEKTYYFRVKGIGKNETILSDEIEVVAKENYKVKKMTFEKLLYEKLWKLLPFIAIFGFFAGAFGPSALASLADVADAKKKGITMGVYSVVVASGLMIGPITTGYIIEKFRTFGLVGFFVFLSVLMVLLLSIRWLELRKKK